MSSPEVSCQLCPICYDPLTDLEEVILQECGHEFCRNCLKLHCTFSICEKRTIPSCPSCLDTDLLPDDIETALTDSPDVLERLKGLKQRQREALDKQNSGRRRRTQRFPTKKSERMIRKLTKPCPGCQAPIFKESGCNHIVCPVCDVDFCWSCGSHKSLSGSGSLRYCETCKAGYIDHRKIGQHRIMVMLIAIFLLPVTILYMAVSMVLLVITGGCFCCFGRGQCIQLSPEDASRYSFLFACLPGVWFVQEMGFSWFDWIFSGDLGVDRTPTQEEESIVSVISDDDDDDEEEDCGKDNDNETLPEV